MRPIRPHGSIVGREVYDKRRGVMGTVLVEDGMCLIIEFSEGGETYRRQVTYKTFRQLFKVLPNENDFIPTRVEKRPVEDRPIKRRIVPPELKGEIGCGEKMSVLFNKLVKYHANQDLDIESIKSNPNHYNIKYNGYNIFECRIIKRRFIVMAHPKSLSPQNKKYVIKEYDKSTNWTLRCQFVFIDESQKPLMKSIIVDGLYYRQSKEVLEREEES